MQFASARNEQLFGSEFCFINMKKCTTIHYKLLSQVVDRIKHKEGLYQYQYFIIIMIMLRYFQQLFNDRIVMVRQKKTDEVLCYETNAEQFDTYIFYLMYDRARWSYIVDDRTTERLSVILYNAIKDIKTYFPSLEHTFSVVHEYCDLDDRCLKQIVSKVDKMSFRSDGQTRKTILTESLNYLLLLYSKI